MGHSREYWCCLPGPSFISSISAQTGAPQVTLSLTKPPPGWLGDSPGGSWLLWSSDKASGQGGAAGMQTNSSSKVQAVPGADGSADSSGSPCHKRYPVTLTINRGALQGQPHGPAPSYPAPLGAPDDIPENRHCVAPGAAQGWTQQWAWGLSLPGQRFQHPSTSLVVGATGQATVAASLFRTPMLVSGTYSS